MSARLNLNEIAYVSWKGEATTLITPSLAMNQNDMTINRYNLRLALPLKIYRKEIASTKNCDAKRIKIDDLNQPGGSIVTASANGLGAKIQYDFSLPNNSYELLGAPCSGLSSVCLTIEQNAKKRVRSSGNIKRAFNVNANNDLSYYADTKQYLEARNRLFNQNQYSMVIKGSNTVKPGAPGSEAFLYKTNGTNHCPDFYLKDPITFQYGFPINQDNAANSVNNEQISVTIPAGYYTDVDQINNLLIKTMIRYKHYYIDKVTKNNIYLLSISYDYVQCKILLQTKYTGYDIYDNVTGGANNVDVPSGSPITLMSGAKSTDGETQLGPYFLITQHAADFLGISVGYYPTTTYPFTANTAKRYYMYRDVYRGTSALYTESTSTDVGNATPPFMQKTYTPLYYKPNNSQYAQQGAVSASSRITRLKYNTITTNASKYRNTLGESVGNALAYGVSDTTYTIKDKIGFPNKKTPQFVPHSGEQIPSCKD